jgi:undecaprenyl-diphosphatase
MATVEIKGEAPVKYAKLDEEKVARIYKEHIEGGTPVVELAIGPLKGLYDRPRPPDPLVETSGPAFPSGHATAGAATAIALVIVLLPPGEHRRVWELRAAGFAFVMALSRTYLRAHWLTDAVAGALLGAALALTVAAAVQALRRRRRSETPLR